MTQKGPILAFDTATGACSVAVWAQGAVSTYRQERRPASQSARLLPMIEDTLREAGLSYADLSLIATTIGPGGFTGIRIGLAAARGMAFAARLPVLGFTTLQVLAFAAWQQHPDANAVATVLNAGKGEWVHQRFGLSPLRALEEPGLGALPHYPAGTLLAGNAPADAGNGIDFPRADALAALAATHPQLGSPRLTPYYVRPPDAKLPPAPL